METPDFRKGFPAWIWRRRWTFSITGSRATMSEREAQAQAYPVDNELAGVTIICPSSVKADALSTACLCLGLEKGRLFLDGEKDVAYLLVTRDGTQYRSVNFP